MEQPKLSEVDGHPPVSASTDPSISQTRTIYLAVASHGENPAHWAVFVPKDETDTDNPYGHQPVGKVIHGAGNVAEGFKFQFRRDYDLSTKRRTNKTIPLAQIKREFVKDTPVGWGCSDTKHQDPLEEVAAKLVRNIKGHPNPSDPAAPNCQDWMRDYVQQLINRDMIDKAANDVLANTPRVLPWYPRLHPEQEPKQEKSSRKK